MLTVYGDESSDEESQRVFAVAGVSGTETEWDTLAHQWKGLTGGLEFHANECDSDAGSFSDRSHESNKQLYRDLTKLLASSPLCGYGVGISLPDYRAVFPRNLKDQPYYMCFQEVVSECTELGYLHIPQESNVKFTFDRNTEREYNAAYMYDCMTKLEDWRLRSYLCDEISFVTRATTGIQVADLLARETMKHLDNQIGPVKRSTRRSMRALADTGRFHFRYYLRDSLEEVKRWAAQLSLPGAKMSEYYAWLKKRRRTDNDTTRLEYLKLIMDARRKTGRIEK